MKKIIVGIAALLCVSCVNKNEVDDNSQPVNIAVNVSQPQAVNTIPATVYNPSDFQQSNIVVKVMGDDYIVYEYIDVGIDKVANLASYFCNQTNPGKSAYLRDIYMTKDYHRRATFDCVDLATK